MFGKEFTARSQRAKKASPATPSQAWNNFKFGAHRSPPALLADSATPSPFGPNPSSKCRLKTSTAAFCDDQSVTRPRQRRESKKRYSFLLSHEDTFKASYRPSFLDVDEDEPVNFPTARLNTTVSEPPHVNKSGLMSLCTNESVSTVRQSISSSRFDESIYFDAEEPSSERHFLSTTEAEFMSEDSMEQETEDEPSFVSVSEEGQDDSTMCLDDTLSDTESDTDEDDMDEDEIILVFCEFKSRSAASFNQNPRLPCTPATLKDVEEFKARASALLIYKESEDTYRDMMFRVERMIKLEQDAAFRAQRQPYTAIQLAKNLRTFLRGIAVGRVQTGEMKDVVQHEMDWADWVHEACKVGVIHVRHGDCRCKPHWLL